MKIQELAGYYKSKFRIGDTVTPKYNNGHEEQLIMRISSVMFREPKESPYCRYCVSYYKDSTYFDYWVDEHDIKLIRL